jgi:hypothetical protein
MADTVTVNKLRRKLGDTNQAFSDAELAVLLDEAGGDFATALREGLFELLTQAARLNDYTTGQSSEKKSQVFQQLKETYQLVSGGGVVQVTSLTYGVAVDDSEYGG